MNLKALYLCAAMAFVPNAVMAGGYTNGNSPSSDWNAHWNFDSANQQQADLNRAIAIEQQSHGAYRAPTYYSTTNIDTVDNGTYYTHNIGSITEIDSVIEGDNNSIGTDASSVNNGEVTGNIATSNSGTATNETTSGGDTNETNVFD